MTSSRSCGSVIPETAARKAAAAVEPFAVDTGGGAGQLDIEVEPDDIADGTKRRRANRPRNFVPAHFKFSRFKHNCFGLNFRDSSFLL